MLNNKQGMALIRTAKVITFSEKKDSYNDVINVCTSISSNCVRFNWLININQSYSKTIGLSLIGFSNLISKRNQSMNYYDISMNFWWFLLICVKNRHFFDEKLGSKKQMALYLQRFSWY